MSPAKSGDHLALELFGEDRFEPKLGDALLAARPADRRRRFLAGKEGSRSGGVPGAMGVVPDLARTGIEQRRSHSVERLARHEDDQLPIHGWHFHIALPLVRAAIEHNLFELLRRVAELPGGELEDGDRMLRITTGLPSAMHNAVARARLNPDDVEPAVEEVSAWYRRRNARFFWWTGPQSSPHDLDDRLAAAGLREVDRDSPGMAMALEAIDESAAYPPGVSVKEAHGEAALGEWARLFGAAHDAPPFAGESWVEAARRLEFRDIPWSYWVARLDGEPAGLGLSFVAGDAVGL
jgi:hypothetical protein